MQWLQTQQELPLEDVGVLGLLERNAGADTQANLLSQFIPVREVAFTNGADASRGERLAGNLLSGLTITIPKASKVSFCFNQGCANCKEDTRIFSATGGCPHRP